MVNHARTLLLNSPAGADAPGEELVPADYRVVALPDAVRRVREVLFGVNPDRAMLNYRLAQLLPLLHATPLDEFIRELDPRVTYTGRSFHTLFPPSLFSPDPVCIAGSGHAYINGEPRAPDIQGQLYHEYQVVVTKDHSTITVHGNSPVSYWKAIESQLTGNLFSPVSLGDSGYNLIPDNSTASWRLAFYLKPSRSIGELDVLLRRLNAVTLVALFGTGNVEPYMTFKNLFFNHAEPIYRVGGICLAAVWRTDEARRRS